jgi:hypothetical protein
MKIATVSLASGLQFFQIELIIRVSTEDFRGVIAAHNHMLRLVGQGKSG